MSCQKIETLRCECDIIRSNEEKDKIPNVFINVDYPGEKGEHLLEKHFKKLGCSTNQKANFVCCYLSWKYCFSAIWKISWTSLVNQMLFTSFKSWLWIFLYWKNWVNTLRKNKRTYNSCQTQRLKDTLIIGLNVEHLFCINNLILNDVNRHKFRLNLVCQNTRIIDESNNWNILLFKEAGHTKEKCPILNNGVKVFREMQLNWGQFSYNEYTNHVLIVSFCSDIF